jgi:hypothetical protein
MPHGVNLLTCCIPDAPEDVHWISPGDIKRLPWAACDVHGRDAVLGFIYRVTPLKLYRLYIYIYMH